MERDSRGYKENSAERSLSSGLFASFVALFTLAVPCVSQADLIDNLDGTITDTDQSLMWLQNASLAVTEDFDVSGIDYLGRMSWNTATLWINAMNAEAYLGYNDWRLPTTDEQPDFTDSIGYNITTSEMGYLYYNGLVNSQSHPFLDIQETYYWSGTTLSFNSGVAWAFSFSDGHQAYGDKTSNLLPAWAVRGATAPVPEPGTCALALLGLAGAGFTLLRRKKELTA